MRLIDADKLIETLHNPPVYCSLGGITMNDVFTMVNEQPTVEQNQWIPCSERLPEDRGEYLVTYHPCYWDNASEEIRTGKQTEP